YVLYCLYVSIWYFFFFFQAEDGIRDFHVTGVQTCALPILCEPWGPTNQHLLVIGRRGMGKTMLVQRVVAEIQRTPELAARWVPRSEERRVGKECRYRGSPYH